MAGLGRGGARRNAGAMRAARAPRVTRRRATPASPSRRHADARLHAAARPLAEAFDEGASAGSGRLRRDAPVSQARRSVVVADRRRTRQRGHAPAEAGKRLAARFTRGDRGGAQGTADARGTQVGLTVCGHHGPDSTHLALRVAVRQLACGSGCGVRHLDACRNGSAHMGTSMARPPCGRSLATRSSRASRARRNGP